MKPLCKVLASYYSPFPAFIFSVFKPFNVWRVIGFMESHKAWHFKGKCIIWFLFTMSFCHNLIFHIFWHFFAADAMTFETNKVIIVTLCTQMKQKERKNIMHLDMKTSENVTPLEKKSVWLFKWSKRLWWPKPWKAACLSVFFKARCILSWAPVRQLESFWGSGFCSHVSPRRWYD